MDLIDFLIRVALGAGLGAVIGLERETTGKSAGLKTHSMVGLGSALFTILSLEAFDAPDPSRVAAQIVSGIGFLGAGAIFRTGPLVKGLTTAAGLWGAAAIGMAAGTGSLLWAATATVVAVVVLTALRPLNLLAERMRRSAILDVTVVPGSRFLTVRDDLTSIEPELEVIDIVDTDGGVKVSFEVDANRARLLQVALAAMEDVDGVTVHPYNRRGRSVRQ